MEDKKSAFYQIIAIINSKQAESLLSCQVGGNLFCRFYSGQINIKQTSTDLYKSHLNKYKTHSLDKEYLLMIGHLVNHSTILLLLL